VLDSLSELRLLAQSPLRYRRQILALKHFFSGRQSTVVLLDDLSSQQNDLQLHSVAHGVVLLEQLAIDYGAQRRRLRVVKCVAYPPRSSWPTRPMTPIICAQAIAAKGTLAVIPNNPSRALKYPLDKHLYAQRHLVECCFSKLKQFRRVATRFEKTARNYQAVVTLAAIILWMR
jgi:hypothetical protein